MFHDLTLQKDVESFSISPENPTGERGKGGMATEGGGAHWARDLGQGWKISPMITVEANATAVLAHVCGEGAIKHIWIGDTAKAGRALILRIYFDGQEILPSVRRFPTFSVRRTTRIFVRSIPFLSATTRARE